MCGIVGVVPLNKTDREVSEAVLREIMLFLHNEILHRTLERGKDATGVSLSFGSADDGSENDPTFAVLKGAEKVPDFLKNDGIGERYKDQEENANMHALVRAALRSPRKLNHIIGHARAKTKGDEFNPLNNHPIVVGNLVGIHNGRVTNTDEIYRNHPNFQTMGEVDSEAIFHLLSGVADDRALQRDDGVYTGNRISGPHTVLAYNKKHPETVLAFHDGIQSGRPLEVCYLKELGVVIMCSKREYLEESMHAYSRQRLLYPDKFPKVDYSWRNIPVYNGFVLDTRDEVTSEHKPEDIIKPFETSRDLKSEYSTNHNTNHHSTYVGTGGVHNTYNANQSKPKVQENQVDAKAEFEDASYYEDDDGEDNTVVATVEAHGETEHIREQASQYLNTCNEKEAGELFLKVKEGQFAEVLGMPATDEEKAEEFVHRIYPHIFADGWQARCKVEEEEKDLEGDNKTQKEQAKEIQDLTKELEAKENKMRRASAALANLKLFLMATLCASDTVAVVDGSVQMSEELEQVLQNSDRFRDVDPELIFGNILDEKDIKTIQESITKLAAEVNKKVAGASQ